MRIPISAVPTLYLLLSNIYDMFYFINFIIKIQQMEQISEFVLYKVYCRQKKQAIDACFCAGCTQNAFMCGDQSCKCKKGVHQDCEALKLKQLIKKLNTKQFKDQATVFVKELIKKIIEEYKQMANKITQNIQILYQKIRSFGLTIEERSFLTLIQTGKTQNINGNQIHKVFTDSKIPNSYNSPTISQFNKLLQIQRQNFKKICDSLTKTIYCNKKVQIRKQIDSKIVKFPDELIELFLQKKIKVKYYKLLYRASQNEFFSERFYLKCSNEQNILILVKTKQGIFGGYTPIKCISTKDKLQIKSDQSGNSFLLSLIDKKTYFLESYEKAVIFTDTYPIAFCPIIKYYQNLSSSNFSIQQIQRRCQHFNFRIPSQYLGNTKGQENQKIIQWEVFKVILE